MTTYYKFLRNGGYGAHVHDYRWNLPTDGQPAAWERKIKGRLIPCVNGYHVLTLDHWSSWASDELYVVETRGELLDDGEKLVSRQARLIRRLDGWNEANTCLFAADCAEHVLPIWERAFPDDPRPRLAIKAARDFARGEITAAARAAAGAAAGAAALTAARDVAGAAAGAAAWDAAWDAAWAAAWAAAGAAAGTAARDVAGASARDVAGASARAAAGDVARDAARDAERSWQRAKLREYLGVEE